MVQEDWSRNVERSNNIAKHSFIDQGFVINLSATYYEWFDKFQHELPPGKPFVKFNYLVVAQKVGIIVWCLLLMMHYQNFTTGAFVYLYLHGTHAVLWLIKDFTHPEQ